MPTLSDEDIIRLADVEQKLAKKLGFPWFMTIPYLSITLAIAAIFIFPAGSVFTLAGFLHLSVISYGIINDILACKDNLEYFRFGHRPNQLEQECIPSTKTYVQAFHWGILGTWLPSLIAVGVITGLAAITAPVSLIIYPIITAAIPIILIKAHYHSAKEAKNDTLEPSYLLNYAEALPKGDEESYRSWNSCSHRNSYGYKTLPLLSLGVILGVTTLNLLTTAGITSIISAPVVPMLTIPMLILIGGLAINFAIHRNTIEESQALPNKYIYKDEGESIDYIWENPALPRKVDNTMTRDFGHNPLIITHDFNQNKKESQSISPTLQKSEEEEIQEYQQIPGKQLKP